ncbi:MAG TPA: hypothetical protein VI306_03680 [Pyrinomonadaceae bacterium]
MDWHSILQLLRDALTVVGAGKLAYSAYRQIKKASSHYFINRKFQRITWLYKKALNVRSAVRSVHHNGHSKKAYDFRYNGNYFHQGGQHSRKSSSITRFRRGTARFYLKKLLTA